MTTINTTPEGETPVAAIMSYGVQTLEAAAPLNRIISRIRRIGHEGFPVVENNQVVGLLNRRDADRAAEHGLHDLRVRDVMLAGTVTVQSSDPAEHVLRRMVETGWWQIPVVDDSGQPIGIVTRTDILKLWAGLERAPAARISTAQITATLGPTTARLITLIVAAARDHELTVYLVGGIVRDLLLGRPSDDIDFVIDSASSAARFGRFGESAAQLAETLAAAYGGTAQAFRPFGTAKWSPTAVTAARLGVPAAELPDHIDFASARAEFYEHPTALPTVYTSSIKLDLARRDFTINALACRFDADGEAAIVDFFGGLVDLNAKRLRVLHTLSFVDDPTRTLRAARFEARLGFALETRTAELMTIAAPMLSRITGERVRTEISLIMAEAEPAAGLRLLETRGCLRAIHEAFELSPMLERHLASAGGVESADPDGLRWHLLAAAIAPDRLDAWCHRLMIGRTQAGSMANLHSIVHSRGRLTDDTLLPSQRARWLDDMPDIALQAAAIVLGEDAPAAAVIQQYMTNVRADRTRYPLTNGQDLLARGLKPGPCFGRLLGRLLDAWRDGLVHNRAEEDLLIDRWLGEGVCDDRG